MSTVRLSRHHHERGVTFLEVVVSLGILSMLALMAERALTSTREGESYISAVRKATQRGQKVSYEVYRAVSASRKLFQRDGVGLAYLDALDLTRFPRASTARLPVIDETGTLGPDAAGEEFTGNVLLFVAEGDPAACVADGAAGRIRYIDTYRFVCIYPNQTTRRVVLRDDLALELVVWRSIVFPSRPQILAIEDEDERRCVVRDLYVRHGCDLVWDPDAPADSAFYAADSVGALSSVPEGDIVLPSDVDASGWGRLTMADVQLARTRSSSHHTRAVFTTVGTSNDWLPNGFEVKITGASGSRKVWLRLVVESPASQGRSAVHPSTMVASVRDL